MNLTASTLTTETVVLNNQKLMLYKGEYLSELILRSKIRMENVSSHSIQDISDLVRLGMVNIWMGNLLGIPDAK